MSPQPETIGRSKLAVKWKDLGTLALARQFKLTTAPLVL